MRISDWSSDVCSSDLAVPGAAVGPAHFEKAFQPHFGESGRQMIDPVALTRLFAGQDRQVAVQEIAEGQARSIDIPAVAVDEVHRQIGRASCRERVCQYV